jgi:RNA polymerase sigma-70 factor (ECF subfamily)
VASTLNIVTSYPGGVPGIRGRALPGRCVADKAATAVVIIGSMQLEQLSDEALVAGHRSAAGAAEAEACLNELFKRHHLRIARWCLRFTNDRESAADLAQEVCVKAYRSLASFQGGSKFSTWLFSIARNHCINQLRNRAGSQQVETDEAFFDTLVDEVSRDPEQVAVQRSSDELARRLLNESLDETEKQVFTLHYADDLPLDAITRLLGLTNASGAKAYIVSARRKLNRTVERWKARTRRNPAQENV